jgi:hypothetical protein
MLAFPALIVSSKPLDPDVQDPPGGFLWPRIYSWTAAISSQAMGARWKWTRVSVEPSICKNEIDAISGWAVNVTEKFLDVRLRRLPVPVGTPIIMCAGLPLVPLPHTPDCDQPDIPWQKCCDVLFGGRECVEPTGVWFAHWMDPESLVCNT